MALRLIIAVGIVGVVLIAASSVVATDYIVGDYNGWRMNYDYETWLAGKTFFLGDRLIFNYKEGTHDVIPVDAVSFKNCAHPEYKTPLRNGSDIVTLLSPGKKWYICGFEGHCQLGMKLAITVWGTNDPAAAAAAAAKGDSSPQNISAGVQNAGNRRFLAWIIAAFVLSMIIV